jgi:cell division protein FtsB
MALSAPPLRLIGLLLLVLLLWLQYRLWLGEAGWPAAHGLQERVQAQRDENRGLAQRNAELAAEVDNLKSGEAAVEERARSELGMIRPGETFYRVVEAASLERASVDSVSPPPVDTPAAQ